MGTPLEYNMLGHSHRSNGGGRRCVFASDVTEIVTSWAAYSLVAIVVLAYLNVLYLGSKAIFSTSDELEQQGTTKRRIARNLYGWFALELLALVGLVVPEAFASLLQLLAPAPSPA